MKKKNGKRLLTKAEMEKVTGGAGLESLPTDINGMEVTFTRNTSTSSGGAIYTGEPPENVKGVKVVFTKNTASSPGGAIYVKK